MKIKNYIKAWMRDYDSGFVRNVITDSCDKFNSGLAKHVLQLNHSFLWM